ncbi:uncharacterized protein LOC111110250 isoform X2 [Crassostrea virginica]
MDNQMFQTMSWLFSLVFVLTLTNCVSGSSQYLYFDSTCDDFERYTIFDDDTYYIKWRGSKLSSFSSTSCSFKFSPYDTDYKVCVEAVDYNVNDCNVNLQYYGGLIATLLLRTYSCFDTTPSKFCGDTYDDLKIKLTTPSKTGSLPGSFTLKVTTKNAYQVGVVAGAVVGGVVFAIIVVAVVIVVCRNRRVFTRHVVVGAGSQPQVVTTSSSSYGGGYANPNYPVPPPYSGPQAPASGNIMNSYPPPPSTGYNAAAYPAAGQNFSTGQNYSTGYSTDQSTENKCPPYPGN